MTRALAVATLALGAAHGCTCAEVPMSACDALPVNAAGRVVSNVSGPIVDAAPSRDCAGLAAAIISDAFATVPGVVVGIGNWRGPVLEERCGALSYADMKVTVDEDPPVYVATGESAPLLVDRVPFTFHAFVAEKQESACADGGDRLAWALIRDAQ